MPELIFHHCDGSPFSEEIRVCPGPPASASRPAQFEKRHVLAPRGSNSGILGLTPSAEAV